MQLLLSAVTKMLRQIDRISWPDDYSDKIIRNKSDEHHWVSLITAYSNRKHHRNFRAYLIDLMGSKSMFVTSKNSPRETLRPKEWKSYCSQMNAV